MGGDGLGIPRTRDAARYLRRRHLRAGPGADLPVVAVMNTVLDLDEMNVRDVNRALRGLCDGARAQVSNARGHHNIAVGLNAAIEVRVDGPGGYYVGGLGKNASITVNGPVG